MFVIVRLLIVLCYLLPVAAFAFVPSAGDTQDFTQATPLQVFSDSLLCGILFIVALYYMSHYIFTRQANALWTGLFFLSFAAVISVLNGLFFIVSGPNISVPNHALLYFTTGISLFCLSLCLRFNIEPALTTFWHKVNLFSCLCSLVLLFSPLYPVLAWKQEFLFIILLLVISSHFSMTLWSALSLSGINRILAWHSLYLLVTALLLVLCQLYDYPIFLQIGLAFSLAVTHLIAIHYVTRKQLQQIINTKKSQQLQQYYDIFHNAVEGLFISTLDGKVKNANKSFLNIFGYAELAQLQKDTQQEGLPRFYADQQDKQRVVQELNVGKNRSFEIQLLRTDNSSFWGLASIRLVQTRNQKSFLIYGSLIDITEQKLTNERLAYLATHDPLTSLFNRYYFTSHLQQLCNEDTSDESTLVYIDIDQFKIINNTCSHDAGDALLKQISDQLKRSLGHNGLLARFDSDDFGILLPGKPAKEAFIIASRLQEAIKEFRFIWQNSVFDISISIGMTTFSGSQLSVDTLLKQADIACGIAQSKSHNRIHIYDESDTETQQHQAEILWVTQLKKAIKQNAFIIYQQTVLPLSDNDGKLQYELLLRLKGDDNTLISPASFITAAERYGLMQHIDRWVIKHYFSWLKQHKTHLQQLKRCFINLSGASLIDPDFKEDVQKLFNQYQIPHSLICFEITESVAIVNLQNTLDFIQHFRKQGCTFALDDFGSGFSSYGYLKHFPVDFIKIDGHFVRDLLDDNYDKAIVKSIHDIAKTMGMLTIAEFVENEDIQQELALMGIDFVQGYAIAHPAPLSTFLR